jgi:hypothetical protein
VSSEEHAESMAALMMTSIPDIEAQRDKLRDLLDHALGRVDPLECLALASAMYLAKDPNTYSEVEDDRSPAHVEFLALSALPLLQNTTSPTPPSSGDSAALAAYKLS